MHQTDISRIIAADLPSLDASLWLLSPACQPYTVLNPSAKGSADPRAKSFLHLIESVLPELAELDKHPRWILVENVAGFEVNCSIYYN
jgi:tRNA (cytosine38-C5)-methyltransferase